MEKTQTKQVSSDIITSLMNGFILSLMYFDYSGYRNWAAMFWKEKKA